MKSILNIILSVIIFGASFQNSLFMIDYKINQDFYEIHCINKSKPQLDCHGKCQMKMESEKSTNPFNLVKYSFEFNILPTAPLSFFVKKQDLEGLHTFTFCYQDFFFPAIVLGILPHPPQV
ncbi:hypothetical protein FNJ88_05910 [Chryseobacterium sp. SNU WT5]|uniref:hypothetical protein n=1 Tax=Chryseobacterium sp. SNU WT5 TaxID=2594269 RepID=UPI00117BE3F3|nr:hypothetical protein [Chryseobacterium sp. SNU WT5]QDP85118.1 hypothetical protein FNJ88_05910 [Chryseobacterium sp. SNU WT5]